jgi:hypothetical protein
MASIPSEAAQSEKRVQSTADADDPLSIADPTVDQHDGD